MDIINIEENKIMNELYFLGMDIAEETKTLVDFTTITCTNGMTENELKAYKLGITNTISALKSVIEHEYGIAVVNIEGLELPTELSIDEVEEYFLDN
jgi:hypothetical protein